MGTKLNLTTAAFIDYGSEVSCLSAVSVFEPRIMLSDHANIGKKNP